MNVRPGVAVGLGSDVLVGGMSVAVGGIWVEVTVVVGCGVGEGLGVCVVNSVTRAGWVGSCELSSAVDAVDKLNMTKMSSMRVFK